MNHKAFKFALIVFLTTAISAACTTTRVEEIPTGQAKQEREVIVEETPYAYPAFYPGFGIGGFSGPGFGPGGFFGGGLGFWEEEEAE